MAISSSSTLEEVIAQYMDNVDWDGDLTKARLELSSVRALLVMRPTTTNFRGQTVSFDMQSLMQQEKRLVAYVDSQTSISNKTFMMRARLSNG